MFPGQKLEVIEIDRTLPVVFKGSENDEPVVSSEVWCRKVKLVCGNDYLIEAESGTGKSSLCSFIYGNRLDYEGRILFNGTDVRRFTIADWCRERRYTLAYLPQEMLLFPELTALENIQIKNRLTDRFSEQEILSMLDYLEIGYKANVVAGRLSVGQQQRVAIIRALCQPFDFILLDEPVSHLDLRNNKAVARLISKIADEHSASIITTSVGNPLLLRESGFNRPVFSIKL